MKLNKLSLRELQRLYLKKFGVLTLENAIEYKYRKYDYIVRLEN